ncbi:MAG: PAS domain-containing sensor histidine kinase, partial [Spirochaetales bacterium]|nr:PAS domain-containing sensor histidine kinase [Spirochaetales bacterium]
MLNRFRSHMKDPAEKIRIIALLAISGSIIAFGSVLTIRDALAGRFMEQPIYGAAVFLTSVFVIFVFLRYNKTVPVVFWLSFTVLASYQLLFGDIYEYNIIYLAVLITGSYFFVSERLSYGIVIYTLFLYFLAFWVRDNSVQYSPDMLTISFFALFLISVYSTLNIRILKQYIKEIQKNRDDLEKEVKIRTEELERSKEYAEFLFKKSPIPILTLNKNRMITDLNEMVLALSGFSSDQILGEKGEAFGNFKPVSDTDPIFHTKNLKEEEYVVVTAEGEKKILRRLSAGQSISPSGEPRFIESYIDMTEYRKLEVFKDDMERVMRHDLKTPLNSIIGFTQLLLENESPSPESKDYLRIIASAGRNMLDLINQSLILYKIESGQYEPEFQKVDIIPLLRQIMEQLNLQAQDKGCSFELNTGRDKEFLNSEPTLLYMIFSNLIKNALEASPKKGVIAIS